MLEFRFSKNIFHKFPIFRGNSKINYISIKVCLLYLVFCVARIDNHSVLAENEELPTDVNPSMDQQGIYYRVLCLLYLEILFLNYIKYNQFITQRKFDFYF